MIQSIIKTLTKIFQSTKTKPTITKLSTTKTATSPQTNTIKPTREQKQGQKTPT